MIHNMIKYVEYPGVVQFLSEIETTLKIEYEGTNTMVIKHIYNIIK